MNIEQPVIVGTGIAHGTRRTAIINAWGPDANGGQGALLFSFLFFDLFYTTHRLYSKSVAFFSFLSSHDVRQQHNTTEATNSLYFIKPHANDRIRKRKKN